MTDRYARTWMIRGVVNVFQNIDLMPGHAFKIVLNQDNKTYSLKTLKCGTIVTAPMSIESCTDLQVMNTGQLFPLTGLPTRISINLKDGGKYHEAIGIFDGKEPEHRLKFEHLSGTIKIDNDLGDIRIWVPRSDHGGGNQDDDTIIVVIRHHLVGGQQNGTAHGDPWN